MGYKAWGLRPRTAPIFERISRMPDVPSEPPHFDDVFRTQLVELFRWRRDVRRFKTDRVDDQVLDQLISAACLAPSVGLSQPWRFVIVDDPGRRQAVAEAFAAANREALAACAPPDAALYARLKLAGLAEAPRQLAVFADETTCVGRGLGRQTMPETLRYSVVGAITLLWLAARAKGLGLGWVSILDPDKVSAILDAPVGWVLIGYFCLGYPQLEDNVPELEREGWEQRYGAEGFVFRK